MEIKQSKTKLYPPVTPIRQNQSHIVRLIIDSKAMIKFLQENYSLPINSDRPKLHIDVKINPDGTKMFCETQKSYLDVVNGEDNPMCFRAMKAVNDKRNRKGRSNKG